MGILTGKGKMIVEFFSALKTVHFDCLLFLEILSPKDLPKGYKHSLRTPKLLERLTKLSSTFEDNGVEEPTVIRR